eukprot:CAMPEP_0178902840 /NCGR_PEP_ID=MMETSP0786-20121207/4828_1 /TAXON_ID=186022 /ORGANISM="Thalassionema frauenfeldii, Strain CCMP 1798" /LENGTH=1332 /DNA_ID=CAMNT_0020574151 /DNA_START=83 /DNA_END=4082 /DNA_ORIENTATION=+
MDPMDEVSQGRSAIPQFNRHGTALSQEERKALAKKNGVCVRCGVPTHDVKMFRRSPLTNEHVYEGKCIKCRPEKCPKEVVQAWELKFKPQQAQQTTSATSRFRNVGRKVGKIKQGVATMQTSGVNEPQVKPRPTVPTSNNESRRGPDLTTTRNAQSTRNAGGNFDHVQQLRKKEVSRRLPPMPLDSHTSQRSTRKAPSTSPNISSAKKELSPQNRALSKTELSSTKAPSLRNELSTSNLTFGEDYTGGGSEENAESLAEFLRNNKAATNKVKEKLHCLRNLGEEAGALGDLKELMEQYRDDPKILSLCCGAIWSVTANDDEKKSIAAEAGCISTIIGVLRDPVWQDNPDVLQWVIGSLSCLCHGAGNRGKLADAGVIEVVLYCMKDHVQSAGVFEWACRLLYALINQHPDEPFMDDNEIEKIILSVEDSDGISIILSAMKQHLNEPSPQMWAIKLLWRLQERNDSMASNRTLESMNTAGGINTCIKLLRARSTTPVLFAATTDLLFNMFAVAANDETAHNKSSDCMSTITRRMKEDSKDAVVQEACCNLLSIVVPKSRLHFKESDGLKEVVTALSNFPNSSSVCTAAAKVLWTTSSRPVFFDETYLEDAFCALEAAVGESSSDVNLLIHSCGFIANVVSFCSTSKDEIPFKIPMNALLLKVEDPRLGHQAGRAICAICIKQSKRFIKVIDKDFIQAMVDNLDSSSEELLCASYDVLIAIGNMSDEMKEKSLSLGSLEIAKSHVESFQTKKLIEKALELMSVLASPVKIRTLSLPEDIFQVVMKVNSSFPDLLEKLCVVLRNLLIISIPASKQLNFESLVTFTTSIIDDENKSLALRREACAVLWVFIARQKNHSQHSLKAMYRSLLSVMSSHNGEQRSYDSDLQVVAAGALSRVTAIMRDIGFPMQFEDVEELMHLLYKILENDIDRVELLESVLETVLDLSHIDEDCIIQTGGIVVVIDIMVENEQSESIQERGCNILAVLSSTQNVQVNCCIAETDGIDMIVSSLALFSGNAIIQESACKALSNLSVDGEARMLITSQGGLMLIINAMDSNKDNVDMLESCCTALRLLVADADEQMLRDPMIIKTILSLMNVHPDNNGLQEKAMAVIQSLSGRSKEFKEQIAKAGGISAITFAMKEHLGDETLQLRAFTTLWTLAVLKTNQIEVASEDGIKHVVNGMMLHLMNGAIQKQGCGCLCTLTNHPDNKRLIREAGAIEALIFSMWAHYNSESVQAEACKVISHLAVNLAMNEVMLASIEEITCLVSAMRRYPDSEKIQEYAVMALRNYVLSQDNVEIINSNVDQLDHLLMTAASRFPEKCSERAYQVMETLSAN